MTAGKIKLAVAIPAYGGQVDAGHCGTFLSLGHALAASEDRWDLVSWQVLDCNPVAVARNIAMAGALAAGADWLLMLDADTTCEGPRDDVPTGGYFLLEMISSGQRLRELEGKIAAVGAAVASRRHGRPMVWVEDSEIPGSFTECATGGGLREISRIATACVAVNLGWIRDCWPDPPWFTHAFSHKSIVAVGEDVWFCDEARARGGKIYVDGRVKTEHVMRAERR
jgi:hypothetical protein